MKIHQVQNQSFQAKQRFLDKTQLNSMHTLLGKMNAKTICEKNDTVFSSQILCRIDIDNEASFIDQRFLIGKSDDIFGESSLKFGKTALTIDNKTGKIVKYKKSLFQSWKNVLQQSSEYLKTACENFHNNDIVKKTYLRVNGFTSKGADQIKKIIEKSEDQQSRQNKSETLLEPLNGVF